MNQQHEMVLEKTHPSGVEEWYCPTCGRRFLMQWPPAYEMTVLEPGDQYAQHTGSKGGLQLQTESDELSEEKLRPWIKALKNLDLNW